MKTFGYSKGLNGDWHPARYPGESDEKWVLPDDIKSDVGKLNAIIETKYTREFLKICAFYNKLFPSLKSREWTRSFYNVPAFTAMDQERSDTGTGISSNYLKMIIDQIVARIGTITFDPKLISDVPTLEYILYKDEVERLMKKAIRDNKLNQMTMECFHDAAILGYSHIFICPVTRKFVKGNDYEIGLFEAQLNKGCVKQVLYRDYAFPISELPPYLDHCDADTKEKIIEETGTKHAVDFKMYFNCPDKNVHITIGNTTLPPFPYPFEEVLIATFSWDIGFSKVTTTSLFDLLYPIQRELNKVNGKIHQLIRMYKGPVPVFNSDVDIAMKAITNGSGEALYINSTRPIDQLLTVINPTQLDPALDAVVTAHKTTMLELSGLQQTAFDIENIRAASTVIALDQAKDTVFQSQMTGMSSFKQKLFELEVVFCCGCPSEETENDVEWEVVYKLLQAAALELKPVHISNPLGNQSADQTTPPTDYKQMQVARVVLDIMKGKRDFDSITYLVNIEHVKQVMAVTMVRLDALGIPVPQTMLEFMISAFVEDIKKGTVTLLPPAPQAPLPPDAIPNEAAA